MRIRDEEQLKTILGNEFPIYNDASHQVCLIECDTPPSAVDMENDEPIASFFVYASLLLRSTLEQLLIRPFITIRKNGLAVIIIQQSSSRKNAESIQAVYTTLHELQTNERLQQMKLRMG
ncbi:hypothetical protein [Paenibacillus sp. MY03]|uniref:hypothetical protein n=1 Tax=Paenibacillus sp. MY03 TaxID=302980 RepID=UPI0015C66AB8|nr:hypothetical protein [Paenibacillus sp. MY03]